MLRMLCFACSLATSTAVFAGQAPSLEAKQTHMSSAEAAIRSARIELNAALTHRDLQTTARYWLSDVSTTGGDGSLWVGRDKNIKGFTEIFKGDSFVSGRRTPDNIEVATGGPKEAAEAGVWEWRERVKGQVLTYGGRYLVMWQLVSGKWLIRSELYVTTRRVVLAAPAASEPATRGNPTIRSRRTAAPPLDSSVRRHGPARTATRNAQWQQH